MFSVWFGFRTVPSEGLAVSVRITITAVRLCIQGGPQNVARYFCPCLCQLLTDFQNYFTGTLSAQFAIMLLLCISPHRKCVCTLRYEI